VTSRSGRIEVARGDIELSWAGNEAPDRPTLVMLHEGLGSVSMWRDFPPALAERARRLVMLYSRHGHGQSARRQQSRAVSYMHDEALVILPELLDKLGIKRPILFGHSDGGSIALLHAARYPVAGVIALAPHVCVEDLSVESIAGAKVAYQTTNLRERLARHHADVDEVFWGWNDIWLHPDFRAWSIESFLPDIRCPVLVIQGLDDEYGTKEQMTRIHRQARDVELLHLPDCGHSPHRDQPERVLQAAVSWIRRKILKMGPNEPTESDRSL
jgi:pimeloyl-ACP methyl ester carboxylesterase